MGTSALLAREERRSDGLNLVWPGGFEPPAWRYSGRLDHLRRVPPLAWISPTMDHVPACFTLHLHIDVCTHMNLHGWQVNVDVHVACDGDPDGDCPRDDGDAPLFLDPHFRTV